MPPPSCRGVTMVTTHPLKVRRGRGPTGHGHGDGLVNGLVVPLGPCRQTMRRELGLACQERQEAVSPLSAWPPGDLGHPPERL